MARHGALIGLAVFAAPLLPAAETIPAEPQSFLARHCWACHAGEQPQAGVRLDGAEIDWQESVEFWERVHDALADGAMPPPTASQPRDEARDRIVAWLAGKLSAYGKVGGAVPRRLNREEYQNTIRDLFDLPDFELPDSFPSDDSAHGFDNVGEGLVLSPPLMDQFLALATQVADEILPPDTGPAVAESKQYSIEAAGFGSSAGKEVAGGRFRLPSSRNMASAAAWPNRFEASQSGAYRIEISTAGYQTDRMFYERRREPFRLEVYARRKAEQTYAPLGDLRKVAELDVQPHGGTPQVLAVEIELTRGETFGLHWANGPAYSDPPRRDFSHTFLADRLTRDRLYYAAMLRYGGGARGTTQEQVYEATVALMESGELDLNDPRLDSLPEVWGGGLGNGPHNWIKAFVEEELLRFGPALDIARVAVEGPLRLIEDDEARARKARTRRFLGPRESGATDRQHAEAILRRFLPRAFRRPVSEEQVAAYAALALGHLAREPDARLEDGLHLAVRRALVSPHFLYRGLRPGRLDASDLASRLSYFLTSAPPDAGLAERARSGELSRSGGLRLETERLLGHPRSENFVRSFTGQWLSTRLLRGIMPDPRLLRFFDPDREAMIQETELFFAEILRENLPLETLVDPGFSYRSARLNKIYGGDLEGNEMRRVTFARGGRQGGVLGLASVMMATANGVDTNPILRGVWLLENVFGDPPPDPPSNVPAIAPDTSGARTLRDQLAAHRADPSCARCHDRIDPLGMALENFDPVGRWRDFYPVYTKPPDGAEALEKEFYSSIGEGVAVGPPVDAAATLPDGTRLEDATDLKRYALENLDLFARCLTEKLMVYATGRELTFGDRRIADGIARDAIRDGLGLRDLVVAIVESESFATQ